MRSEILSYGDCDDAFDQNYILEYRDDYVDDESIPTVEEVRKVYGDEAAEEHRMNLERLKPPQI